MVYRLLPGGLPAYRPNTIFEEIFSSSFGFKVEILVFLYGKQKHETSFKSIMVPYARHSNTGLAKVY